MDGRSCEGLALLSLKLVSRICPIESMEAITTVYIRMVNKMMNHNQTLLIFYFYFIFVVVKVVPTQAVKYNPISCVKYLIIGSRGTKYRVQAYNTPVNLNDDMVNSNFHPYFV